ncbi:hypothetical protein TSH7_10095 [Azospirillum sp. TSH7]|uniref:hypothetical protein n=1 Tax=unclassified Azospirillum TaxID=2630922 RepID=UPI000D61D171|nr:MULTISPECIES: hypothetical protein [unclassified Azospirillum]PWC64017.1 hypothetical protein TSH20_19190 [Azospirillum sp. TSH20]PWC64880.1 hypothetical protein TSH7_10095 [Azospirillum sp. TSH7]
MNVFETLFAVLDGMSDSELQAMGERCAELLNTKPTTPTGWEWTLVCRETAVAQTMASALTAGSGTLPFAQGPTVSKRASGGSGGGRPWAKKVTALNPKGKGAYCIEGDFVKDRQLKDFVGLGHPDTGHACPILVARRWDGELEAILCEAVRGAPGVELGGRTYPNLRQIVRTGHSETVINRAFSRFDGHELSPILNGLLREGVPVMA